MVPRSVVKDRDSLDSDSTLTLRRYRELLSSVSVVIPLQMETSASGTHSVFSRYPYW